MIGALYISHATCEISVEEVAKILRVAHARNPDRGLTGVLLYHERMFLQYLEGPDSAVSDILEILRNDRRHRNMLVLINEPIAERHFPDWAMALADIDGLSESDQRLCRDLAQAVPEDVSGVLKGKLQSLVRNFRKVAEKRAGY